LITGPRQPTYANLLPMSWVSAKLERAKFQVRPGLLLFAIVFFGTLLLSLTPLPKFFGHDYPTVRFCFLTLGTINWCFSCFLLYNDSKQYQHLRMSITLFSLLSVAVGVIALVLFTFVPLRILIWSHLDYLVSRTLMPNGMWGRAAAELGWITSFFGRGRSRLFLVISSTILLMLWPI
jgi:hypothetical protein